MNFKIHFTIALSKFQDHSKNYENIYFDYFDVSGKYKQISFFLENSLLLFDWDWKLALRTGPGISKWKHMSELLSVTKGLKVPYIQKFKKKKKHQFPPMTLYKESLA